MRPERRIEKIPCPYLPVTELYKQQKQAETEDVKNEEDATDYEDLIEKCSCDSISDENLGPKGNRE